MLFLLFLSIAFATADNLLLHGFNNRGLKGAGDILLFNAMISGVWIAVSFVLNGTICVSGGTALWGVLYGSAIAAFFLAKMQAMASGSASVTSFVGGAAFLIPTVFGVLLFHEKVTVVQIVCLALLVVALFLCISPKGGEAKPGWRGWCALFFAASGACGLIFKSHQASEYAAETDGMMLVASAVSFLVFLVSSIAVSRKREGRLPRLPKSAFPYFLGSGVMSFGNARLNIMLSGRLPSIIFFPTYNGLTIVFTSLSAALIFRERLERKQLFGIVLGTASVVASAGVIEAVIKLLS